MIVAGRKIMPLNTQCEFLLHFSVFTFVLKYPLAFSVALPWICMQWMFLFPCFQALAFNQTKAIWCMLCLHTNHSFFFIHSAWRINHLIYLRKAVLWLFFHNCETQDIQIKYIALDNTIFIFGTTTTTVHVLPKRSNSRKPKLNVCVWVYVECGDGNYV